MAIMDSSGGEVPRLFHPFDLLLLGELLRILEHHGATPALVRLRLENRVVAPPHKHVIVCRGTAERAPERMDWNRMEVINAGHPPSIASA